MALFLGTQSVTPYVGAIPLVARYLGSTLVWAAETAPDALGALEWELDAEATGPYQAAAYVTLPLFDAAAIEWRSDGGAWSPAVLEGARWRLVTADAENFGVGTYDTIEVRWRETALGPWSDESDDAKGFTVTAAFIDPVVAVIVVHLTPGLATIYDTAGAFEQTPGSPDWAKEYRVVGTAPWPHSFSGSILTVDTPIDHPEGDQIVQISARFVEDPDAPVILPAPVAQGPQSWVVQQNSGIQSFAGASAFTGIGITYTISGITGVAGTDNFEVNDGAGGIEPLVADGDVFVVGGGSLAFTIQPITGLITVDTATLLTLMSGVNITVRATNNGGFAEETIEFAVTAA